MTVSMPESFTAAVAVVIAQDAMLFIERASRNGDPWSGDIAFPGGMAQPNDLDLETTARRETLEEVGLDLSSEAYIPKPLTNLNGGQASGRTLLVAAFVYQLRETVKPPLKPNYEVADAFWVPFTHLVDPAKRVRFFYPGVNQPFYGVDLSKQDSQRILWGLTYRFVEEFFNQ